MGMYDVINNEQIKIFDVPIISLSDLPQGFLFFSGGSLNEYDVGEKVPYQTYWYNYTKDFNIIDFFPTEYDETVIHKIRDGKNAGVILLKDITKSDLQYDSYNDHGRKMNINTVDDIKAYIDATEKYSEALRKQKNIAFRAWSKFVKDSDKTALGYMERYKELYLVSEIERKENKKLIKPFLDNLENFFLEDNVCPEFHEFGGILQALSNPSFAKCLDPDFEFVVSDERLLFVVGYNKLVKYSEDNDFLKRYMLEMKLSKAQAVELLNLLNHLDELYKQIKELSLNESQFNRQYVLSDIINGRYKKYYLEYNIEPYEDFDYSNWDVCLYEECEREYSSFNEELELYVKQKMDEIER